MAENERGGRRGNRWRSAVWGTAASLLLLPLVAMQLTDQVVWGAADFIIFGAMARALVAMAFAQTLVAGIALIAGEVKAAVLTLVFAGLWVVSASLFRTAAHEQSAASAP